MRVTGLGATLVAAACVGACARFGDLGRGLGRTLASDFARMPASMRANDPGAPGPEDVVATGIDFRRGAFPLVLYRPQKIRGRAPAVIFLPGRFAPEEQYESYARALASHGFVVAVRGRYGWFYPDVQLVRDTILLADWLTDMDYVDSRRIGVAGHSMGGCDAIWAAAKDPRFRAIVSIDPGGATSVPVINEIVGQLRVPLLLIGAELGWRGWDICAPRTTNYERFFEHAPPGTLELTIRGADHVQLMDEPDALGQQICRGGTADSAWVRILARRATVAFFAEHLQGAPHVPLEYGDLAVLRVRGREPPPPPVPGP